ncbi:MAG: HAD hydrolase family protein [Clostridium sp.]
MKGIVSFDMDMTLLNHADYKIPDSAIKALDLLRKNYYIVIATGRDMDAKFSEGLADEVKPDAIIHLNGNKITIGSELIYEHCMKRELVEELLQFRGRKGLRHQA